MVQVVGQPNFLSPIIFLFVLKPHKIYSLPILTFTTHASGKETKMLTTKTPITATERAKSQRSD
jgi:hypothetical protein